MKRAMALLLLLVLLASTGGVVAAADSAVIGVNVVLSVDVSDAVLADLAKYGKVRDVVPAIKAVTLQAKASVLPTIQALPYVASANPDAVRNGSPVDTVLVEDFANGLSTWDLDAINVTDGAGLLDAAAALAATP